MKFFSVFSAIFVLALASFVAASIEQRDVDVVTLTTVDTVISCAPEVTQCHHTTLSAPVVTSTSAGPKYTNATTFSTIKPNATNTTTTARPTFTGGASSISGSLVAVALGIVGVFAMAF
ncbi:hypothetical protein V1525DRAFT_360876 [Lipomyces kononenkoae]|uniref:Uncharacterized protein n=1 Tax=Lipomyces kononenkoae TaxID=34357 RepID=A0ACC3T0J4_LIPKO